MAESERLARAHEGHEGMHSAMFFIILFGMVGAQVGLHFWKQRHPSSYQIVTLAGLVVFPGVISLYNGYLRMLVVLCAYCVVTGWLILAASRKPLHASTPRRVYRWFAAFYRISYVVGIVGYVLVMAEFFGVTHLFSASHSLAYYGSMALFYGLFYGVLSRDMAEVCSTRMAATMGFKTSREDGIATRRYDPSTCAICGDRLSLLGDAAASDPTLELPCKHAFHSSCIKGWFIVGKQNCCPYCSERVSGADLNMFKNPWETSSLLWANLLDALRYLVVWNPFILITIQGIFYLFDLH